MTLCKFFAAGRCNKVENCPFQHDPAKQLPTIAGLIAGTSKISLTKSPSRSTIVKPLDTNARPCSFFARGLCTRGDQCAFKHLKSAAEAIQPSKPKHAYDSRASIPCKFYVQGSCMNGDNCPFLHQGQQQLSTQNETNSGNESNVSR
jgi:hypothetical protein